MAQNPPNLTTINGKGFWIQSLGTFGLENSYVAGTQKQVAAIAGGLETAWVQNGYLSLQTMLNGVLTERVHISSAGVMNIVGSLQVNGVPVPTSGANYWNGVAGGISYTSGNVGIGTASPGQALSVCSDQTPVTGSYQSTQLRVGGATNQARALFVGYDTTGNIGMIQAAEVGVAFHNLLLNPLGGNVGIGTASPFMPLEVHVGTNQNVGIYSNSGFATITSVNDADSAFAGLQYSASGHYFMQGNVGIGTASPTSKLQVVGLPTYASDSAAGTGGLTSGAFYIDASGGLHAKL